MLGDGQVCLRLLQYRGPVHVEVLRDIAQSCLISGAQVPGCFATGRHEEHASEGSKSCTGNSVSAIALVTVTQFIMLARAFSTWPWSTTSEPRVRRRLTQEVQRNLGVPSLQPCHRWLMRLWHC